MVINDAIVSLSFSPFDPEINFLVAQEYDSLGQTAAAISFYLRTAEYGYDTHRVYAYTSLIKMAKCFEAQNDRELTVSGALLQAVALMPDRPEAYALLSQFFEKTGQWRESYTWAVLGQTRERSWPFDKLPAYVGYDFEKSLKFQIAVTGYWLGRQDQSIETLYEFVDESLKLEKYMTAVNTSLGRVV